MNIKTAVKTATISITFGILLSLTQARACTESENPSTTKEVSQSESFLPFGYLLQCSIKIPMRGQISAAVWHNGKLIIPAGTDIHAITQKNASREEMGSTRKWKLVFENGRELPLSATVMDYPASNPKPGTFYRYITQTVAL